MYLFSLRGKLPYFARTEHKNYSRSIDRFSQEMSSLQEFQKKTVVWRRDIFWSGVSQDLCIEQTLMASF